MKSFKYLIICTVLLTVGACTSSKTSLPYFEDIKTQVTGELPSSDYAIKIIPDDELMITVTSLVPEATLEYNLPLINPATSTTLLTTTQPRTLTYRVDKAGDINFPQLGTIHVAGLTTEQLTQLLTKRISRDVEDPYVKVELANFRDNVLGEVQKPGAYNVTRERYTVLDALADAGDLTQYGERNNVLIIREVEGKRIFYHVDLNKSDLMTEPYFYLQQNDVVYVEPNAIRKDVATYNQNNSFKIQVVSAIVSACSVIASLCIALFINK